MQKVIFLLLVSFLSAGLTISLLRNRSLNQENQALLKLNEPAHLSPAPTESQSPGKRADDQAVLIRQQARVDRLAGLIATQSDWVNRSWQRLRDERARQNQKLGAAGLRERLDAQKQLVLRIESQIAELRDQKETLSNQSRSDESAQISIQKQEADQLGRQIDHHKEVLSKLRERIASAKAAYDSNAFNLNAAAEIQTLRSLISAEKAKLQGLREQLEADTAQWTLQLDTIRSQADQETQDLSERIQELSNQLTLEKNTLQRLNSDLSAGTNSEASTQAALKSAQSDFDTQQARLSDLRNQFQIEKKRLQRLRSAESSLSIDVPQ